METLDLSALVFYTEASDAGFHLTRTCLFSFIKHNQWFTGKVVLLVHPAKSLSPKNYETLLRIYPKVEIKQPTSHPIFDVIESSRHSSQYLDLVTASLKWTLFSDIQTKERLVYFSNLAVFQKSCEQLFISDFGLLERSNLLFHLTSPLALPEDVYLDLLNKPMTCNFLEEKFKQFFMGKFNPSFYPSEQLVFSSDYLDAKFSISRSRLSTSRIIFFNSLNSANNHSKVNQLWLFSNREAAQFLEKPESFNPSVASKPNVTKNISKTHVLSPLNARPPRSVYSQRLEPTLGPSIQAKSSTAPARILVLGNDPQINQIDFSRLSPDVITLGVNRIWLRHLPNYFFFNDIEIARELEKNPQMLDQLSKTSVIFSSDWLVRAGSRKIPAWVKVIPRKNRMVFPDSVSTSIEIFNSSFLKDCTYYVAGVSLKWQTPSHFWTNLDYSSQHLPSSEWYVPRFKKIIDKFKGLQRMGLNIISVHPDSELNHIFRYENIENLYCS